MTYDEQLKLFEMTAENEKYAKHSKELGKLSLEKIKECVSKYNETNKTDIPFNRVLDEINLLYLSRRSR